MNIIGQIEKEDILTLFIEVDKYYLYQVELWHKSEQWILKSAKLICSLNHHIGLCCEEQESKKISI